MARDYGPIYGWHRGDTIPTEAEGGYAGAASTASAVGASLAQSTQAVQTVDNLTATATALPPGASPTVTVSGPVPNKVINIGVPRGADGPPGMGYEEGQQLLADSEAAQTSAAQAAADAATALEAQFLTQDEGVGTLLGDATAGPQTNQAMRTHFVPSRQVKVEAMPSWTGDPADDQTAAFTEAAAAYPGATLALIPAGTWKVQGAPVREGLYYRGEGSGPTGTVLTLPDAVGADPMFIATHGGPIWAGGIANVKMVGDGAERGLGATPGVHGIDLFRLQQTHGFWVTDCHIERFDHGIRGAQNNSTTAVGDDRWLIIEGCLIWDNLIGIYANEHPQLAGNDVRRNDIGLTGRLFDLNLTDRNKFIRNRVGIHGQDPVHARPATGSSVISGALFFRNSTAMIVDKDTHITGCFIEGGEWNPATQADVAGQALGIVVRGENVSVVGNYFNPSVAVENVTDILVDMPDGARADLSVTGNSFNHGAPGRRIMQTQQRLTGLTFTGNKALLRGTSHGLMFNGTGTTGNIVDCHIAGNTFHVEQGRVFQATSTDDSTIADNHISVSGGVARVVQVMWGGSSATGSTWAGNRLYVRDGTSSGGAGAFLRVSTTGLVLTDNSTPDPTGYPIQLVGGASLVTRIAGNVGFRNEVRGTVAMDSGASTTVITHGIAVGVIPAYVQVAAINGQADLWVTDRTATQFTINRADSAGAIVVAYYVAAFTEVA